MKVRVKRVVRRVAGVLELDVADTAWHPPILWAVFACPFCRSPRQFWPVLPPFDAWDGELDALSQCCQRVVRFRVRVDRVTEADALVEEFERRTAEHPTEYWKHFHLVLIE